METRRFFIRLFFLLTFFQMVLQLEGSVVCYKKFRKRRAVCKRPLKRQVYSTAVQCCSDRGSGWTRKVYKVGKNSYQCTSCEIRKKVSLPPPDPVKPTPATWGEWTDCTVTCGAGWRSKYRQCPTCDPKQYGNQRFQPCMIKSYCPVDGNWGPWYQWYPCSKICGGGKRSRTRACIYPPPANGGKACKGSGTEEEACNTKQCPIDGKWGNWTMWSTCTTSCGFGSTKRIRSCDKPEPKFRGKPCGGNNYQVKKCVQVKCPQAGGWSLWSSWSPCPVTCGTAFRLRNRECNSPKPLYGGNYCRGPKTDKLECRGRRSCPVSIHGSWSIWSEFGSCNARRCSGIRGFKTRHRTCSKPKPRHYGKQCRGRSIEKRECYNNIDCPVDGKWCQWSQWNHCTPVKCSLTIGMETRARKCACPKAQHSGDPCPHGSREEKKKCTDQHYCKKIVATQKTMASNSELYFLQLALHNQSSVGPKTSTEQVSTLDTSSKP